MVELPVVERARRVLWRSRPGEARTDTAPPHRCTTAPPHNPAEYDLPVNPTQTILTADIDRHDIARARLDFDAVGRYARPDVFRLIVDETSRAPVAFQPVASAAPSSDRGTDQ